MNRTSYTSQVARTSPHCTRSETPQDNRLLAALPPEVWARWKPHLQAVDLQRGQVLCEAGCAPGAAVFPTQAIVSLMNITRDGASAEVAVVGREGVVGVSLFMGGGASPSQSVVQSGGAAWSLAAPMVREEAQRAGPALLMLLRYTMALTAQVAQTAVCNRHHSIDQQFCRRLLLGLDRSDSCELALTHEAAAQLLGVRREGVTAVALRLQQEGMISYRRGHITVLDRRRLEQRSCECYLSAKGEHDRLLPPPPRVHAREAMALAA